MVQVTFICESSCDTEQRSRRDPDAVVRQSYSWFLLVVPSHKPAQVVVHWSAKQEQLPAGIAPLRTRNDMTVCGI